MFTWRLVVCLKLIACYFYRVSLACGCTTHIEISYRALYNYGDRYGNVSYDEIARDNQDALEAGSSFPDAFYTDFCFQGKYSDISEDTHWTPFINASINYIQRQYPKPWDKNTQKLVAFIMGVQSHQVADVSWHSLGIDQGFLQAMAKTNFHGNFSSAHSAGDLGGDVLNLFQLDLSYSKILDEWYVPASDLLNIYKDLYGTIRMKEDVLITCTQLLYLVKVAERVAVKKYFPISAEGSPFLVDELYSYFLGGIEDMSMWTQRVWKHLTFALEKGQSSCNMDHNPLFIRCNDTSSHLPQRNATLLRHGFYSKPSLNGFSLSDVLVEKSGHGLVLRPGKKLQRKVRLAVNGFGQSHHFEKHKQKAVIMMKIDADNYQLPSAVLSTGTNYSGLGSSYAVADLNGDGNDDVVIGASGFYSDSNQKSGIVFILFGTDNGFNLSALDISQVADLMITGPDDPHGAYSKFGSSLAILDIDKDGKLDIAVGSPSFGSVNLTYNGKVFIYSPVNERKYILRGFVTCEDEYCNLGTKLITGDLNSDLYSDLIIGSPFAPGQGEQQGTVGVVYADAKHAGQKILITMSVKEFILHGSQNYSWLGKSMAVKKFPGRNETYLAIGEPNYRICARKDCTFDSSDVQAVGQVYIMSVHGKAVHFNWSIQGVQALQLFGSQLDFGRPLDKLTNVLAIAATGENVAGHVAHIPVKMEQVGSVFLYNLSNPSQDPITVFKGDRKFGRFGGQIRFSDLNRDGFDDLIIGAALRTDDVTEELTGAEQGRVYIYLGGPGFPKGDATSNCGLLEYVEPCPGKMAWKELTFKEDHARFGSQFEVIKSKNKVTVLVTAEHSSSGSRLSGSIGVFEF